ncbi:glycosyltransferase family 2 protein [Rhodoblastus acidophilus]|uniref:Glycosyltransferase family 2 protein n=1 Tax=Candidatus Rhodoblastus alkanivorans TaxID=2954117 RepID=A0ABS9Z6M2_9HYPH|nr:glycosyltransferase family 2 protein [Candidatus Rhodoblastus alkanivorans]MCI4679691.1 glycosyltransferase family 2 protein [Candidatus Rhodoblastus alkanivorans]MCI4683247.1 glycosyltransferase family 2 protein [Candidatus Rhodoblastus alkanivorans]MDI4640559.1 glycosyltransferase family 2 protein [Rhodoblastus acidophilus]
MHDSQPRLDAQVAKDAAAARREAGRRLAAGKKPSLMRLALNPSLVFLRVYLGEGWLLRGTRGYIRARAAQLASFLTEATHFQMATGARSPAPNSAADIPAFQGATLPLSATIICKNEGGYIEKCVASLDGFAEIVVVDSGSTDATLDILRGFIARGWPIKLVERDWLGYAKQKQFAWEQATRDWVLSIDSDEWLDDDLRRELPALLAAPDEVVGWRLRRPLAFYGQLNVPPKDAKPERIIRLARREKVRFDESALVHEGLVADGRVLEASRGLLRHDRALRIDEQILKEATYACLKAQQRILRGKKPSLLKLVVNPPLYFLRIFFLNRVFLYWIDGYILARTRAAYSFIGEALHYQLSQDGGRRA